jgi:pimeloyl-ACP methyl ester carboxylesterase
MRRHTVAPLAALLVLTVVSLAFNAVDRPPERIEPGFGERIRVGSASVHYQHWGRRGTPVVLVPGFLESSVVWSTVGPVIGRHHRVYALDLPGHGYTRYRGSMTLRAQADLVDGFIHALHLRRPTVVGHSLGAAVVGSLALRDRSVIGRAIFADGDGLPINLGPRWMRAAILGSPYVTSLVRIGTRWHWAADQMIDSACGHACPPLPAGLAEQWLRPLRQRSDERALHDLMVNADYGLTPRQLAAIAVPTSIIWGGDDRQGGSLDDTITNLHDPPVQRIEGAGHLSMLADPEAFARAVG